MTTSNRITAALADRYRIERELGAGGMATVYLAADLKHDRQVAIKVLKPELAAVLGAERFVQEIKTTAALSHPHILPLFDSGEAGGFLYYVMPYIEGETIREKLNRETQFGIDEAVRMATEVADALDYAHRHGVIHRDIKPENILLHDGRPMVMDFGIALAVSAAAGGRMTETGLSLGTPHYMSPEQATADRDITARSDIYSLASVLYEMLTGNPPHMGSSAQQIIMRIIAEPVQAVSVLRKNVPPNVSAAVDKALEKLPADRFDSARGFAEALGNPAFGTGLMIGGSTTGAGRGRHATDWRTVATTAIVALVLGIIGTSIAWRLRAPPIRTSRLMLELPANQGLIEYGAPVAALSPDGSGFLYWGRGTSTKAQLMYRAWDRMSATPLRHEAEIACCVVYSPGGDSLAYLTSPPTSILVAPVAGGIPRTVADTGLAEMTAFGSGVDWGDDGWLYASGTSGLVRVSPDGGQMELVVPLDTSRGDGLFSWPRVLPGARAVLVTLEPRQAPGNTASYSIGVADLAARNVRVLTQGVRALYAPTGHLVVAKADGSLWAVPFDPGSPGLGGSERALPDTAAFPSGLGDLALSSNGTLIYTRADERQLQPVLVDRTGAWRAAATDIVSTFSLDPRLDRDGRRLVVTVAGADGSASLWITPIDSGPKSRLTFDRAFNFRPTWRPGAGTISYTSIDASQASRGPRLAERAADGSGDTRQIDTRDDRTVFEHTWSPDGVWLVYRTDDQMAGNGDIMGIRPGLDSLPTRLAATEATEVNPAVSPDGHWLAYVSNANGKFEVLVSPFPATNAAQYQVSTEGGEAPLWSPTGRELFYLDAAQRMIAIPIAPGPGFQPGNPHVLFPAAEFARNRSFRQYDVMPDGRTFVMARADQSVSSHVVVVFNFLEELKRRMAQP